MTVEVVPLREGDRRHRSHRFVARALVMGNANKAQTVVTEQEAYSVLENKCGVHAIAELIRSGKATRIVCMVGAGISVSAGIPDFRYAPSCADLFNDNAVVDRTPGTGLYDNLQKYNLPTPESVFQIDYFQANPSAFYQALAQPAARPFCVASSLTPSVVAVRCPARERDVARELHPDSDSLLHPSPPREGPPPALLQPEHRLARECGGPAQVQNRRCPWQFRHCPVRCDR